MQELLEQYLTEKHDSHFQSSHLREVVAYKKWSLWESWHVGYQM